MTRPSSRKMAAVLALLVAAGLTVYYFHSRDEALEAAVPVPRAQGMYTAHELEVAVAKYPASPAQPAEATQADAEFEPPEPVKSRGDAKSAAEFRAAMEQARTLQAEWKLFTNDHRSAPRHEWPSRPQPPSQTQPAPPNPPDEAPVEIPDNPAGETPPAPEPPR